jgi:hypothetical protein
MGPQLDMQESLVVGMGLDGRPNFSAAADECIKLAPQGLPLSIQCIDNSVGHPEKLVSFL